MTPLTRRKLGLYLAAIFVAGALSGGVISWRKTEARFRQAPPMEKVCGRMQDRLQKQLELSEMQMQQVRPILDRADAQLRAIHTRSLAEMSLVLERSRQELMPWLSAEQRLKLEQMEIERRAWLARHKKPSSPDGSAAFSSTR